jgi:hypothetical protein
MLIIHFSIQKQSDGSYQKEFRGTLTIAGYQFEVSYQNSKITGVFTSSKEYPLSLNTLINALGLSEIPEDFDIILEKVTLSYDSKNQEICFECTTNQGIVYLSSSKNLTTQKNTLIVYI